MGQLAERRFMRWPIVQRCRIEIRAVWPDHGMNFRVEADLIEELNVAQRAKKLASQNWAEVDSALCSVIEPQLKRERGHDLNGAYAIDGMAHVGNARGSIGSGARPSLLQSVPIIKQFLLMQLSPGFDETPLASP